MNRRHSIHKINLMASAALLTPALFVQCASDTYQSSFLTKEEYTFIDSISDFVLPTTDQSPGARVAKVTNFIDRYITACYSESHQELFRQNISLLNDHCLEKFRRQFSKLTEGQKVDVLNHKDISSLLKSQLQPLILFAYFTSQTGMTEALRYDAVPGKYDGTANYIKGDRAWAL